MKPKNENVSPRSKKRKPKKLKRLLRSLKRSCKLKTRSVNAKRQEIESAKRWKKPKKELGLQRSKNVSKRNLKKLSVNAWKRKRSLQGILL